MELEQFVQGTKTLKVSSRDVPIVLSQKQDDGTTVAAQWYVLGWLEFRYLLQAALEESIGGVKRPWIYLVI